MPELPECENVVRSIRPLTWGCEIIGFMVSPNSKAPAVDPYQVKGQKINHIGRLGKYIIFKLDDGYLVSHLRMTGQWYFTPKDQPAPNADKHFRWGFTVRDLSGEFSGFLWFKDTRKFGTLEWVSVLSDSRALNSLGPDGLLLNEQKTTYRVATKAERTKRPVKNFLLDQRVIAGCGNIYACLDPRCCVFMADGSKKRVNQVQVGEQVLSRNPRTGLVEPKKVVSVSAVDRGGRDLYRVKPVGSIGSLKCTEDHRVFTDMGWVEAKDLDPHKHRVAVPSEIPNSSLEQEGNTAPFKQPKFLWENSFVFLPFSKEKYDFSIKTVWDLEVEDNHNFISDSVLVHNCEVLFESKVSPFTPARELPPEKIETLCLNLYDIFQRAIDLGGSSISDYEGGLYHEVLRVYGRENESCFECDSKIQRVKQAGRSTFFCPKCQGVEENELF